jgi:hypothetical protein
MGWGYRFFIMLGVPTYDDTGVEYHVPRVENLTNALLGIHRGLSQGGEPPRAYQGVAIYCEWETSESEWQHFRGHFHKQERGIITGHQLRDSPTQ